MIEKRYAALKPMRHAHAIFDVEQRRQQALEVEVRHLVEIRFFPDIFLIVEDCSERFKDRGLVQRAPIALAYHICRAIDHPKVSSIDIFEKAVPPELLDQGLVFTQQ